MCRINPIGASMDAESQAFVNEVANNGTGTLAELLLILGDGVILNKRCVTHHHHSGRIHIDPLVRTSAFLD